MRTFSLYGKNNKLNIIRDDEDLFLLHSWYNKPEDTLYVLYKRYSNGEKILDVIREPHVPVFISKAMLNRYEEYIPISNTNRFLIPYKNKFNEVVSLLFTPKTQIYKNEWGQYEEHIKYPDIPYGAEALHPRVFGYDINIEEIAMMEFAINRYKDMGDGLMVEDVPIPHIRYAGFDIETYVNKHTGITMINTNTFVDYDSGDVYLDILNDQDFSRINEIIDNPDKFKEDVIKTLNEMIDGCNLKKSKEKVQNFCRDFVNRMNINIRVFDTERELIVNTTDMMFNKYNPDILMAFYILYDITLFQQRIEALDLDIGTFNSSKFRNTRPPFASQINIDGSYRGDTLDPTKRVIYTNNISETVLLDLQTTFFANRNQTNFDNYKLNTVAMEQLGFGKYDFGAGTSIFTLAYDDFYDHSIYAIIDSVLLVLINELSKEIESRLAYCISSKCNLEKTPHTSTTTIRSAHADIIAEGYIFGNNRSKILANIKENDIQPLEKLIGIPLRAKWELAHGDKKFGGAIVAPPNKFNYDFNNETYKHHPLQSKHNLTMFRILRNLGYFDFKSFYPNMISSKNMSQGTLVGRIESIYDGTTCIKTVKNKYDEDGFRETLGSIHTTLINDDIITYGSICNNLPSMTELIEHTAMLDSDPLHTPKKYHYDVIDVKSVHIKKFISMLKLCNVINVSKQELDLTTKDNAWILLTNGVFKFDGGKVRYKYITDDIATQLDYEHNESVLYGTMSKDKITIDNSNLELTSDLDETGFTEFIEFDGNLISELFEKSKIFTYELRIGPVTIICNGSNLYIPDKFSKIYRVEKKKSGGVYIDNVYYRYKELESTYVIDIMYELYSQSTKDKISVEITQRLTVLKLL